MYLIKSDFEIHNSPLSEAAVVGFEYGYNVENKGSFNIWEAQYGDFSNMAQMILITSYQVLVLNGENVQV